MPDADDPIAHLDIRVREGFRQPGLHRVNTCWVKEHGRSWKSVALLYFGRSPTELTHRELHVQKWERVPGGIEKTDHWSCRDDEVDRLQTFVNAELGGPGEYTVMAKTAQIRALLEHLETGELSSGLLSEIASKLVEHVEFVSDLDDLEGAELLGLAVDVKRRRAVIERFEALVADPATTEPRLQKLIDANWWLLGATYVEKVDRRKLTLIDQFDIPLIRADGVLHIIELKRANIRSLVVPHRNHFRVGDDVNEAVNQAANYLREADELTDAIRSRFDVECRRSQATVIIGHPDHNAHSEVSDERYREAIRTYNSHLSRIEVLTYEDVITTARHSTGALAEAVDRGAVRVEIDTDEQTDTDLGEEPF